VKQDCERVTEVASFRSDRPAFATFYVDAVVGAT
jgi:hypothetical protein